MLTGFARLTDIFDRFRSSAEAPMVRTLRKRGFHVVPDFVDRATCSTLIEQIEELFARYPQKVQHEHSEGTSGDYRLFGAEIRSPLLNEAIASHDWPRRVGTAYMGTDIITYFAMVNRLTHVQGATCNSGAGWHRDSAGRQFKAIVYLTDVGPENGPFMILPASNRIQLPARANARNKNRFDDATVTDLARRTSSEIVEVAGSAGTCILVDTSHIHRGKDIQSGARYAVTNYYYQNTPEKRRKLQEKWGRHLLEPLV
jgi:hypothetical protein